MCVVFTLNPYFYPTSISTPSVRPDSSREMPGTNYVVTDWQKINIVAN